jgi:hypothetical protein
MKKFLFLAVAGAGFLLGSKTGNGPYQKVESQVRKITGRSEVHNVVEQAKSAAGDQVDAAAHKVGEKLPTSNSYTAHAPTGSMPQSTGTEPSGY